MRSGFVALAGRPNAGKSTLTNRIVGEKVAIVSDRPQTTRRAIRGIATTDEWQIVLTDLPGVQRPRDTLTTRMQRRVERELSETDAVVFVVNALEGVGPGDRFIASLLRSANAPVIAAVNKVDRASQASVVATLAAVEALGVADAIVPISAKAGEGVDSLIAEIIGRLPEGPAMYPEGSRSDQPVETHLAELVREQVLSRTREEIPHAAEVQVDEIERGSNGVLSIRASILVESESQKGIIVGKGGRMIKSIGTAARREIQRSVGSKVHLELTARVRRDWRGDERVLDSLGIE
jgi:GTP-binding protein Era